MIAGRPSDMLIKPRLHAAKDDQASQEKRQRDRRQLQQRRGGARFISGALSTMEVVPVSHATVKKLYGTIPHSTNSGKCGITSWGHTRVKMNVSTPIITSGLSTDHNTPSDMFR